MKEFLNNLIYNAALTLVVLLALTVAIAYITLTFVAVVNYGFIGILGVMIVTLIIFSAIETVTTKAP